MVDRLERLLNLVIALRETRRPLTAEKINEKVAGYGGQRNDSWRRMFERDKADLRDLGIPVRTERLDRLDDTIGYRIEPDDYDLPSVSLEPAELTALALAVQLTGLGDEALPGLDKLAVDADVPGAQRRVDRLPLELGLDAPNRGVLAEALLTGRQVAFSYRKVGDAVGEGAPRRVDPQALLFTRGRWYLRGNDRDRDAERTFRLDRIEGEVRLVGEPGAVGHPDSFPDPRQVIPTSDDDPFDAVVRASEEVAWTVARRARGAGEPEEGSDDQVGGWRRFTIRVSDPDTFLTWILELGPEVEVLAPESFRRRIIGHLAGLVT